MNIRQFKSEDIPAMTEIWNEVVLEANAFPQIDPLTTENSAEFFASQSFTGVCEDGNEIVGLYILHPNNVGRCGHLANASYAVKSSCRGKKIGERLVIHCLNQAKEIGFRVLQFNAVVKTNTAAIKLYHKLGFTELGVVPGGFMTKDGRYEDIVLFYYTL